MTDPIDHKDIPAIETSNMTFGYNPEGKPAKILLTGVDLQLNSSELICLIGANGTGKSTILRTLSGLLPVLEGSVKVLGNDLKKIKAADLARQLSVVLTDVVPSSDVSVYDILSLGRFPYTRWDGKLSAEDEEILNDTAEVLEIKNLLNKKYYELSDGERQKVMIGRAITQETDIILLDEPTAFLDLPYRVEIMRILRELAHKYQKCILMSTHNLDLAIRMADRLVLIVNDGRITTGVPEDLIIDGVFEKVFISKDVKFDPFSGDYFIDIPRKSNIHVSGEGLFYTWTKRALERIGYKVENNAPAQAKVKIEDKTGLTYWVTEADKEVYKDTSVEGLVKRCREVLKC